MLSRLSLIVVYGRCSSWSHYKKMRSWILVVIAGLALVSYASAEKKIVCYYTSWSTYRPDNGKFEIEHIDPKLCTHLIYSFIGVADGNVVILEPYQDIEREGFSRFNALRDKNPKLKTLVAIGGWNVGSVGFSKSVSNSTIRARFVRNLVAFVKKHNFSGLDVDWEYPAQRNGSPNDVNNFVALLKELREAFDKEGFLLSAAVAASESSASRSYKISEISKHLHFINLMAYDFHGSYDGRTGFHSALYPASSETYDAAKLNVKSIVEWWISQGAPAKKLILGVPTYARTFTVPNGQYDVGTSATIGRAGPYTRQDGMLGYNEICEQQKNDAGWQVYFDEERRVPYAFKGDQWMGYDNPRSAVEKAVFVKENGLGGAMVWSLDTDDFLGICGIAKNTNDPNSSKFPIIKTLNNVLRKGIAVEEYIPPTKTNQQLPTKPNWQPPTKPSQNPTQPSTTSGNGKCMKAGIMAHPTENKKFYQCVAKDDGDFIRYVFTCPDNLIFKELIQSCDWP